jgi:hypothetical protein
VDKCQGEKVLDFFFSGDVIERLRAKCAPPIVEVWSARQMHVVKLRWPTPLDPKVLMAKVAMGQARADECPALSRVVGPVRDQVKL